MEVSVWDRDLCSKAADALTHAFEWKETPEGYEFWSDIHARLILMVSGETEFNSLVSAPANAELLQELEALRAEKANFRKRLLALDFTSMGR